MSCREIIKVLKLFSLYFLKKDLVGVVLTRNNIYQFLIRLMGRYPYGKLTYENFATLNINFMKKKFIKFLVTVK
jgi:hypothetical protein